MTFTKPNLVLEVSSGTEAAAQAPETGPRLKPKQYKPKKKPRAGSGELDLRVFHI